MDSEPTEIWQHDDTIRAEKVSVGLARNAITGKPCGIMAMLTVPVIQGDEMQVSVVMSPEQAITFANALTSVALDMSGVNCLDGDVS